MKHAELVERLNFIGMKKSEIERVVGMPRNSLSGFMNGSKKISNKWISALEELAERHGPTPVKVSIKNIDLSPTQNLAENLCKEGIAQARQYDWVKDIEELCNQQGLTPEELIVKFKDVIKIEKARNDESFAIEKRGRVSVRDLNAEASQSNRTINTLSYVMQDRMKKSQGIK